MRCTSPRSVGFRSDGKTLCWSPKKASKEYANFQLPCGKCLECRLDYARQWAIRCVHEAQMHEKNSFITLTYADEHLSSPKLVYSDFQKFMKRLRRTQNDPIGVYPKGEYGEQNKRPHWHAILFGWEPADKEPHRKNKRGDQIWSSRQMGNLWPMGFSELGSVTFESAGYCARYAAKKLVHGKDKDHEYHPIGRPSSKHAIGKKWLEAFWPDVFLRGKLVLRDGQESTIPRYYEKWFKQQHPDAWLYYVTHVKTPIVRRAQQKSEDEIRAYFENIYRRNAHGVRANPLTKNQTIEIIQKQKFKILQSHLKL